MNAEKIKRIIAREGLILLAFLFVCIVLGETITRVALEKKFYSSPQKPETYYDVLKGYKGCVVEPIRSLRKNILLPVFLIFYLFYWIIRFIIWAVRTLKQR